ncbi:MAG: hypothetical protein KA712_20340 [Myxococcales bacterium]|nr:hypothetical protein [Myxococcales bacterium]
MKPSLEEKAAAKAEARRQREEAARAQAQLEQLAAEKRAETVILRAGVQAKFAVNVMPRPNFALDTPPSKVVQSIANPQKLRLEFPMTGSCERVAACRLPCTLSWLVRRQADGAELSVLVAGLTEVVIAKDGRLHVEVEGRPPVLDIVEAGLAGHGELNAQLTFAQPHLGQVRLARSLPFRVDASVAIRWQDENGAQSAGIGLVGAASAKATLFGTHASIAVATSPVLDQVDLAVEILDAEGKAILTLPWKAGKRPTSVAWSMGFTGISHHSFSALKPENGTYDLGCRLVALQGTKPRVLLSGRTVVRVQQPLLTDFRVTYSPGWLGTYRASGKILRVTPEADLRLTIALVDAFTATVLPPKAPEAPKLEKVEVTLADDGSFSAALGIGHFQAPPADTNDRPVYAILSFPAAERTAGVRGAIAPYLAHNDETFALWEGGAPTWSSSAPWIASEEAPLAMRGKRPPAAPVNVLAEPADLGGDPYGPLTADIAYGDLRAWEGEYAYMYRDSAKQGYVTVGCGLKVDDLDAVVKLPLVDKVNGVPASAAEKRAAFERVMQEPRHATARGYADRTNLVLTKDAIISLAKELVDQRFVPELKKIYGEQAFDSFPLCVRRALVDMAYNAGTGNMKEWNMTGHIRQRAWQLAANEVPTAGRQERRAWRRSLLNFAASLPRETHTS